MPLTHRRGCGSSCVELAAPTAAQRAWCQQHTRHSERATTKGGVSSLQLAEAAAPCFPCRPAGPTIQCHLTGGDTCSHHGLPTRILAYNTEVHTLIKPPTRAQAPGSCCTACQLQHQQHATHMLQRSVFHSFPGTTGPTRRRSQARRLQAVRKAACQHISVHGATRRQHTESVALRTFPIQCPPGPQYVRLSAIWVCDSFLYSSRSLAASSYLWSARAASMATTSRSTWLWVIS
jgi:hypothetical protein